MLLTCVLEYNPTSWDITEIENGDVLIDGGEGAHTAVFAPACWAGPVPSRGVSLVLTSFVQGWVRSLPHCT